MALSKLFFFAGCMFVTAALHAAQSGFYGLARVRHLNAAPTAEYYSMQGFAQLTGYEELVVRKNGTSEFLTGSNGVYGFVRYYGSDSGIESSWPFGYYDFSFRSNNNGAIRIDTVRLFMGSGGGYADALTISNLTETSTINPSESFTFRWANPGTSPANYLHFRIEKAGTIVFQSEANPWAAGVLSASAKSIVLPASVLAEGTKYDWFLSAVRTYGINESDIPNARGFIAYKTQVQSSFTTRWALMDAQYYFLGHAEHSIQTSTGPPVTRPNGSTYELFAHVGVTTNGSLAGATLQIPNSIQYALTYEKGSLHFSKFFAIEDFLAGTPGGSGYQLKIEPTHNPQASAPLAIYGPFVPPPQISNFAETQVINPLAPFALRWNLDSGASNCFVSVRVLDGDAVVAASPAFRAAEGALNGTNTSFSIPAAALQFGKSYDLEISAFNSAYTNYNAYPGAVGESGVASITHAQIKTIADPGLNLGFRQRGDQFELFWPTNRVGFSVQRASDLNSQDAWKTIPIAAVAIENNWTAPVETNSAPAFYRLIKP